MKYILKDIKTNWIMMLSFLLMNVVMFVFMINVLHVVEHSKENLDAVRRFQDGYEEAYMVVDDTSEEQMQQMLNNEEQSIERFRGILNSLYEENTTFFTSYGYDMYETEDGMVVRQQMVSAHFFELFSISTSQGRLFQEEEYKKDGDVVPVLIGYELQNEYELGKEYEFANGGDGKIFKGKVVGILKKNSDFRELSNYQFAYSLDRAYVIPMSQESVEKMSFSDLDMATTRMVVFGDRDKLQRIFSLANITSMTLRSVKDQVAMVVEDETKQIKDVFFIGGILLLIILALTWIGFNHMFKKNLKEYYIHIFCGAQWHTIFWRFVALCAMVLFIGWGLVGVVCADVHMMLQLLVVAIFILVLVSVYPFVKLKRKF